MADPTTNEFSIDIDDFDSTSIFEVPWRPFPAIAQTRQQPHQSYIDYLISLVRTGECPEFEPLVNYLREPIPQRLKKAGGIPERVFETCVLGAVAREDRIDMKFAYHVIPGRCSIREQLEALKSPRMAKVLSALGSAFDVDPGLFLAGVSYVYESPFSGFSNPHRRASAAQARQFLHLYNRFTAQAFEYTAATGERVPIVVLLIHNGGFAPWSAGSGWLMNSRPSMRKPDPKPRHLRPFQPGDMLHIKIVYHLLRSFQPEDIKRAEQNPYLYLEPWLRFVADDLRLLVQESRNSHSIWTRSMARTKDATKLNYFESTVKHIILLAETIDDFDALIAHARTIPGLDASPVVLNYAPTVVAEGEKLTRSVREQVQLDTGLWAIEESRKSIQEAASVKRLTQLAFIFIPLNFVTSFFGMNIIELNGNGPKIWIPAVTAACITVLTIASWSLLRKIAPFWTCHAEKAKLPAGWRYYIKGKFSSGGSRPINLQRISTSRFGTAFPSRAPVNQRVTRVGSLHSSLDTP